MKDGKNIWNKAMRKIRNVIIGFFKPKSFYHKIYCSYWHHRFSTNKPGKHKNYYTAVPNRGARIGHQLANWIAGYWFARQFGLEFAHTHFSTKQWDTFLGFGENEISVEALLQKGFKKVRLPLFDESNPVEVALNKKIIQSYNQQQVIFVAEQDQFYKDQFGVIEDIQHKFYHATARKDDKLIFSKENFNIAIHVRRGDIVAGQENKNPNLLLRWQDNKYFENVIDNVLNNISFDKPIAIYLFSQGDPKEFSEFKRFDNIHFCLHMNAMDSFLHMVYADLLITSKSSFSYKPALLSKGFKICPADFWHGYPSTKDFILASNDGKFQFDNLKSLA
ncbi:hypothetical protein [Ferruginibacter sp.]|uniref:hypothetical protein n=1 Tax=Ferruginibacter sp. TaxID=1940288 RepID=UPI002659829D|nr:hypothetical protein [Ferruginibacter sp.]